MSGNAPKILVVVLVVVAVLFFVGVAVGSNNGIGGLSLDGVINSLTGLLPNPAVRLDEIDDEDGCLNAGLRRIVVPGGRGCSFHITSSSANVRALKLQVAAGQGVRLVLMVEPAEGKSMEIETALPKDGNNQTTLNIFTSGGRLTIDQCTAGVGSACVIDLVQ